MRTVLMVAEKPSLAQSLAKILSNGSAYSRKGSNGACSIHEYKGRFYGESVLFKMTSVCGHIMGCDFHGKYNNWDKVDPVELFTAPIQKKEATPNLHMPNFLRKEAQGADYLVLWLDCDKEGENICFEVMECTIGVMNRVQGQQVYRAKFSAITETDIKRAMQNLGSPNKNEALSVDARQELDLRVGCAFTRYQTRFFQGKYGDLDSTLISYGPCQTPTLGFCVDRHDKILSFKPEPYWILDIQITHPKGKAIKLEWDRGRLFDKEVVMMFLNMVKRSEEARVVSTTQKEKVKPRPMALNTVELLRVASSGLGIGPHRTMQIAERLYTQGYISYPRTETTKYPDNFDLKGVLVQQRSSPNWGNDVEKLLRDGIQRPKKGSDAGDHPPITPMKLANQGDFDNDSWRIYDYVTRHFIGTLSPDCKYKQTTVNFEIGIEKFTTTGNQLTDPGYTSVMPWQALSSDEEMPIFTRDQTIPLDYARMQERQTTPPDYLTEAELISLMEKNGIGTDASIPVHINNICERNYVNIISGRKLKPTPLGIVLVHGYKKIDPELVLCTMRSSIEKQLNLIALGKANYYDVKQHAVDIFHRKFQYFVDNIHGMDQLFEVTFSSLASVGKPLSRCGKCRRYMKLIQAKPSRLHCSTCDETYSLPQNGIIKLYKELKCPLDEFELILWTLGPKAKTFPLCPFCYNHPPFNDMKKGMGCNECSHPTCPNGFRRNTVTSCLECDRGALVIDQSSGPKWRMACNKCNLSIRFLEHAIKLNVTDERCRCGANYIHCTFPKDKSKLPNNAEEHTGCAFCDPALKPLMEKNYLANSQQNSARGGSAYRGRGGRSRGGRGGGGGGGRGGRGGGRGGFQGGARGRGRGRGGGRGRGRGGGDERGRGKPRDKMAELAAYFV